VISTPITPSSDLAREVPTDPCARLDSIAAAVATLRAERRRCLRLGLELPIARCESQLRYWEFLGGLFAIEPVRSPR
jgi:hypothetical protein